MPTHLQTDFAKQIFQLFTKYLQQFFGIQNQVPAVFAYASYANTLTVFLYDISA